ncbi:AraC family transcriptional regulator [Alcaligenaceae bacterium 429]|nr:AraC family transcriptional regulator [Alcaligenaceae bacterium 429]
MSRHAFSIKRIADLGIEIVEAESGRHFAKHVHEQYGIGMLIQGAQRSSSGRGQVEATAGDLISVNPAEVHDGMPIGDVRRWHMLYFDPAIIATQFTEITADTGFAWHEFAYPVLTRPYAAERFSALYSALTKPLTHPMHLALEEHLLLLLELFVDRPIPASSLLGSAASKAQNMIDDDPLAELSLAKLANEAGLSRFQLVRAFSRLTGLTPHAYVVQKRVHLAKRLISKGVALAEASYASGFSDQSHMTRHFVRSFGFSPGLYARRCS